MQPKPSYNWPLFTHGMGQLQSFTSTIVVVLAALAGVIGRADAASITSLQAAPMASTLGQAVTLSATVSPGTATGKVTFYDETAILGSASLSNGTAVLSTTGIAYGTRHIKARYIGDANNSGS